MFAGRELCTVNPGEEAQTLVPSALIMAALSTLLEPIRLRGGVRQLDAHSCTGGSGNGFSRSISWYITLSQRML